MNQIKTETDCRRCGESLIENGICCLTCQIELCPDCFDELTFDGKSYCPACHNLTPNEAIVQFTADNS